MEDSDFFDIFSDGNNSDTAEATALLKRFFPLETLAKLDSVNVERVGPDGDATNAMGLDGLENESRLKKDGRNARSIGF